MPHTNTLLQNFARRDAHKLAQKFSLLTMASWVLACQWAHGLADMALPDAAMVTIIVGLLAYATVNTLARLRFAANDYAQDELLQMFVIVDAQ
jgi:hypothetical protein